MDRIQEMKFGHKVTDFSGFHGKILVIDHAIFFRNFIHHKYWAMLKYLDFKKHDMTSHYVVDLDRTYMKIPDFINVSGDEIEALKISGMQFVEHAYVFNKIMFEYKIDGIGS